MDAVDQLALAPTQEALLRRLLRQANWVVGDETLSRARGAVHPRRSDRVFAPGAFSGTWSSPRRRSSQSHCRPRHVDARRPVHRESQATRLA